jgi:hypothetical protein
MVMPMRICLLAFFFTLVKISMAANSASTQKDQLAFEMFSCLRFLETCKTLENQFEELKTRGRSLSTLLEISQDANEAKFRPLYTGYQKEFVDKI